MNVTPTIVPIACLETNYAYLVFLAKKSADCVVVDPSEAAPVKAEIAKRGLRLCGVLNTHHHWDHVGGNMELLEDADAVEGFSVFGHESEFARIPGMTTPLKHGERFSSAGLSFVALHVPGHTRGALAYHIDNACFTGDTLFCGGCGRLFEGTPEQMQYSLTEVLGELPDSTIVYTGHEYTQANLEFAMSVLPSRARRDRLAEVSHRRALGEYCASASLELERATNPFLACGDRSFREALGEPESREAAFAKLRRMKDTA